MGNPGVSTLVFLQVAVILPACRAAGVVARRWGKPQAIGRMIAAQAADAKPARNFHAK